MPNIKILIVEDDTYIAEGIKRKIKKYNYNICSIARSGEEAIKIANDMLPDLILMDIKLDGEIDGIEAARQIRNCLGIPVIYLTAYSDDEILKRARKTEPSGYILKPVDERELHSIIEMAVYNHSMEKRLKESHKWFSTTLKSIGDGVICTDKNGFVSFVNSAAEKMTGWKKNEALKKPLEEIFHIINEESRSKVVNPILQALKEGIVVSLPNHTILVGKEGTKIPITGSGAPIRDDDGTVQGTVLVAKDITEQKKIEYKIKTSLMEKEILLKEIHHRVKNNLAVVADFLYFQSEYAKDEETVAMFKESQNRIKAMALIHEKLYGSDDLTKIDFAEYIEDLAYTLISTYKVSTDISLKIDVQGVFLTIDTAIPCGILINELVSNCCKHAFSDRKKGEISIFIHPEDNCKYKLVVSDNGVGMPSGFDICKSKSLGLEIVNLSVKKLNGSLNICSSNGCKYTIIFSQLKDGYRTGKLQPEIG